MNSQPRKAIPIARKVQLIIGCFLLAAWALWWGESFYAGRLLAGSATWVPVWPSIGFDFLHNYLGVRYWLTTGNPYLDFRDPANIPYNYAPIVLGLFTSCGWVELVPATITWSCAVAVMIAMGAWHSASLRTRLDVAPISRVFAVALMLLSTGAVFSMERGNCDALVVLMLLVAAVALKRTSKTADATVGIALALATLIKVYPALAAMGLLVLGRRRAFFLTVAAGLLISAVTPRMTIEWLHNIAADAAHHHPPLATHVHTISGLWSHLFDRDGFRLLLRVPPLVGAGIILMPLIAWVSLAMYRSDCRILLAWPYLLWLTQAATFWSPVSYDYKLLFMPLTMLCLWERRSPCRAHALLVPFLLYWQPWRIAWLGPVVLLVIKVAALFGTAILVQRAARDHLGTPSISGPQ